MWHNSYPTVLNFIRYACTRTGLRVSAYLDRIMQPTHQPIQSSSAVLL